MNIQIKDIINTILQNRGKAPLDTITPEMDLRTDIGFDSLDLAELTVRIEAQFDVDIFENGIVSTVAQIVSQLPNE